MTQSNQCVWKRFGWVLFLAGVAGCNPVQPPQTQETHESIVRVEALRQENQRLQKALVSARQEVATTKQELQQCAKEQKNPERVQDLPSTVPVFKEIQEAPSVPPCQVHLLVKVPPEQVESLLALQERLQGWGLERIQILKRGETHQYDVFFNGPEGSGQPALASLHAQTLFQLYEVVPEGLKPFSAHEHYVQFQSLFPDEASRLKLFAEGEEEAAHVTSLRPEDIRTFANQVLYRAPHLNILPMPDASFPNWRSLTVKAEPVLEQKHLQGVRVGQDENGVTLLLRFTEEGTLRLSKLSKGRSNVELAFSVNGQVFRTRRLHSSPTHPLTHAEVALSFPLGQAESSAQQTRRIASLLSSPPLRKSQLLKGVLVVEECIQRL